MLGTLAAIMHHQPEEEPEFIWRPDLQKFLSSEQCGLAKELLITKIGEVRVIG
jgi:hypothetical protein